VTVCTVVNTAVLNSETFKSLTETEMSAGVAAAMNYLTKRGEEIDNGGFSLLLSQLFYCSILSTCITGITYIAFLYWFTVYLLLCWLYHCYTSFRVV